MKLIIQVLTVIVIIFFGTGLYFQYVTHNPNYTKIMGAGVLILVFLLLPVFLYYRYKDKNINDYKFKGFDNDINNKE